MAQSPTLPKKQDKRKSSGCGGWRQQGRGRGWTKFEKGERLGNIGGGGIHKIRGVRTPLPTIIL